MKCNFTHIQEFLQASQRSTAPASAKTKPVSGEEHLRRSRLRRAVGFLRPIQASFARSLRDSCLKAGEILPHQRKFLHTAAIRTEGVLEILGFRGWENAASVPKRGTAWAPSTESLGFLALRSARGKKFPLLAGDSADEN